MYVHVCQYRVRLGVVPVVAVSVEARRGRWLPGAGFTRDFNPPDVGARSQTLTMKEQQELRTTKSPLQPTDTQFLQQYC